MKATFEGKRSERVGSGTIFNGTSALRPARCPLTAMKLTSALHRHAVLRRSRRLPQMTLTDMYTRTMMSQRLRGANDLPLVLKGAFPITTFEFGANFRSGARAMAFASQCTVQRFGRHAFL